MNLQIGLCKSNWRELSDQMSTFRPFASLSINSRPDHPPDMISQPQVCPRRSTTPFLSPELQFLTAAGFEKPGVDRFTSNCSPRTFNSSHSRRVIRPQPRMARIDVLAPRIYNHDVGMNYVRSVSAARASSPSPHTSKEKDLHTLRTNNPSITLPSPREQHESLKSPVAASRLRPPHLCMTSLVSRSAYLVDKTCLTLNRYCRVAYAHGQVQHHHHQQHQHQHQHPSQTSLALPSASLSFPLHAAAAAQSKRLFGCPQCRYLTDRKNNLKRHVLTMHQESTKSLECCGVSFRNKASLRDHVLIFHSGGYKCRYCGRNFCRKALLKRHLSVHSGQKDFVCALCDYATSHKSNLERHKKVHERCRDTMHTCQSDDHQREEGEEGGQGPNSAHRPPCGECQAAFMMGSSRNYFPFLCNVNGKVTTTLGMPGEGLERVNRLFPNGLTNCAGEDSVMKASSTAAQHQSRGRSDPQEMNATRGHDKITQERTDNLLSDADGDVDGDVDDDVDDDVDGDVDGDDGRSTASEFINVVDLVG